MFTARHGQIPYITHIRLIFKRLCTVILPPGDNQIAVNKYIISYHINKLNTDDPQY